MAIEQFLEQDIDLIARFYTRTMAPDVELARRFGRADTPAASRLEAIEVQADIAESKALYRHDAALGGSSRWVDGLRASVRPLITYAFFILFAAVKGSGLYLLIVVEGLLIAEALPRIWDPETQALFAAVMSFWFGNWTLSKLRERR